MLAFHPQCHVAELAALDSIGKAVAACNSEYASSEGHGDAAAYEAQSSRLRAGRDHPWQRQVHQHFITFANCRRH